MFEASKSSGLIPAHFGIISDSCPPQLTAIKKCFRDSQNRVMEFIVPSFKVKVNKPQAPLICSFASRYWEKDGSNGNITSPTLGCDFKNDATSLVVLVSFSNRAGRVLNPRISSQALKGEMPLPMLRYSLSNIFF